MALIIILSSNIYFWNFCYLEGIKSNYDSGVASGNKAGYQLGFKDGNQSGFEHGYQIGYSKGNHSGYSLGYSDGTETSYNLGFYYGNISGYQKGIVDGNKTGFNLGYNIRDPTYQEMLNFIALDKTDENEYSENYTCFHFTADVKGNAFKSGIKCGFVYVEFPDSAHAIVCFNTTNCQLIYIEPQSDDVVTLIIGQPYWDRTKYQPSYNDTVMNFVIIW
jgi:hypothetical protein